MKSHEPSLEILPKAQRPILRTVARGARLPSGSSTQTLLDALRDATRECHRRLEATVKIESKLDDHAAYQQLLERFLGVYEPIESQLVAQPELAGWGYDAVLRAKAPALHRDLGAMGLSVAQIAALPRCPVPPFQSVGAAFGAVYVLEGSTLGGQMISRLLAMRNPTLPAQFFHGYGEETRDRWGEFVGVLLKFGAQASSYQDATSAAGQTFSLFQEWLR